MNMHITVEILLPTYLQFKGVNKYSMSVIVKEAY